MIHKPCARAFYSDMVGWLDETVETWRQNGPDGKECADLAEEELKRAEYLLQQARDADDLRESEKAARKELADAMERDKLLDRAIRAEKAAEIHKDELRVAKWNHPEAFKK